MVEAIKSDKYDAIIINFANPDMLVIQESKMRRSKAIEAVDACVGRTVDAIKEVDGVIVDLCRPRKCRTAGGL